jgi:hypothetical protein
MWKDKCYPSITYALLKEGLKFVMEHLISIRIPLHAPLYMFTQSLDKMYRLRLSTYLVQQFTYCCGRETH